MVWGRGSVIVFQEKVQVSNLIEHDRIVDDACAVDLVQLLDRVLLLEVEAENSVQLLTVPTEASDQQDLRCGDLHGLKAANRLRDLQVHLDHLLLGDVEPFNRVETALVLVVAAKDENDVFVKNAG